MKQVIITSGPSTEQGTLSRVSVPHAEWACFALELPWKDNRTNVSCIPAGEYEVAYTFSPHFGKKTYQIINVPERSGIRIHSGVWAGDKSKGYHTHSLGCPLFGKKYGTHKGQKAIFLSSLAIGKFERLMHREPFVIKIRRQAND